MKKLMVLIIIGLGLFQLPMFGAKDACRVPNMTEKEMEEMWENREIRRAIGLYLVVADYWFNQGKEDRAEDFETRYLLETYPYAVCSSVILGTRHASLAPNIGN